VPDKQPSGLDSSPRYIVGIGASAGGLEAIERFFDGLPNDLDMAYIIVQHLSPDFRSLMDELLLRWTSMPIYTVSDGQKIEPNSIYLLPPGKEIAVSDSKLLLKDKDPQGGLTFPIDHFLRSLAQDAGERAVGIVMSGTGTDGSRGIVDVHCAGGTVIVQTEDSAKFTGMPHSAADTGLADWTLSPGDMQNALQHLVNDSENSDAAREPNEESSDEVGLQRVFTLIRDKFGLELKHYKPNTIIRRTERRMQLEQFKHIDDYARHTASSPDALRRLYEDLLIGVTRFFRDPEAYEKLRRNIVELVEATSEETEIRVWSAGCSTGQEAYSLAILLDEALKESGKANNLKIFATDIDHRALEIAQAGQYPIDEANDLSNERIEKYFTVTEEAITVSPQLRQMIVFAQHNLLRDAPFTKIDLVVCRNLLIYMQPNAQKKILSLFHFGLRTRGTLFLGPSETTSEVAEEFETIENQWKLFRKHRDMRMPADFRDEYQRSNNIGLRTSGLPQLQTADSHDSNKLLMSTYDAVLAKVMPDAFLCTEEGRLLHTFGNAGSYLKNETGRYTPMLAERIIPELRAAITTGIRKAIRDGVEIVFSGIELPNSQVALGSQVTVTPVEDAVMQLRTLLIRITTGASRTTNSVAAQSDTAELQNESIVALESELADVRQSLQATIQELETSNEELQATNEEMQASNEELQSTNEELHSVNEELYTVNAEHQNKITQLSELTRDMDNLLQSTEVHTLFLDSSLRIRKFTPRVAKAFNLIPQDIGRCIDSFKSSISCEDLAGKLNHVIDSGEPHEEEVIDGSGTWYLMRLLPYRSADNAASEVSVDGALLTLVDITKLREASRMLEDSIRKRDQFLAMLSHELRNPLSTIVNTTHVLHRSKLEEGISNSVDVIRRQSRHMATLLDDLLDVTRVSQGKIHLERSPLDLRSALNGAVEAVGKLLADRKQTLTPSLPSEAVMITGSEPRMIQVVSNLPTNASKYSGVGKSIAMRLDSTDEYAEITIEDDGVGIAADQLQDIFEMFEQADRTLHRSDGGLGVGLTLVRALVEMHDGEVAIESDGIGKGTRVVVKLPLYQGELASTSKVSQATPPAIDKMHVVLVEDNADAVRMLGLLLEDLGCHVSTASDGIAGIDRIVAEKPHLAIVDIGLPEASGYTVAKRIRSLAALRNTRLVALTGYGQASDRQAALEAGFDEHIVKPIDPEYLDDIIRRAASA